MASTTEIIDVRLDRLLPNPHRDIGNYPINPDKVDALVRSMQHGQIGMWPSIIARPHARGFEKAFGHHRQAAAEKLRLPTIPVIVMTLSDEQMLQYMGRENSEDYGTDFTVLLNTWEAAYKFRDHAHAKPEPLDIARLLGWASVRADGYEAMTPAALACNSAFALIRGGHIERNEFAGLSTRAARDIAQRALSMMATIKDTAKINPSSQHAATIHRRVQQVGATAKQVAKKVREGEVAPTKVRTTMTETAYRNVGQGERAKLKPLFAKFCYATGGEIGRTINHDTLKEKLDEIITNVEHIIMESDEAAASYVGNTLQQLAERADKTRKDIDTALAKLEKLRDVTKPTMKLIAKGE
jgi:hypothetical protein